MLRTFFKSYEFGASLSLRSLSALRFYDFEGGLSIVSRVYGAEATFSLKMSNGTL